MTKKKKRSALKSMSDKRFISILHEILDVLENGPLTTMEVREYIDIELLEDVELLLDNLVIQNRVVIGSDCEKRMCMISDELSAVWFTTPHLTTDDKRKRVHNALLLEASGRWATAKEIIDTCTDSSYRPTNLVGILDGLVALRQCEKEKGKYRLTELGERWSGMYTMEN